MVDENELEEFRRFRERIDGRIPEARDLEMNRFSAPDALTARGTPGLDAGSAG